MQAKGKRLTSIPGAQLVGSLSFINDGQLQPEPSYRMPSSMDNCCADCGKEGGVSLKTCKSFMLVKYCNAECQQKHWSQHKTAWKRRAAEH